MRNFFEYFSEFLYRKILIDKKWTCRYGDTLHLRDEASYEGDLLLFVDEAHLRSEEVEIEIEYAILTWDISAILIHLVFILYTRNLLYYPISESRLYIVSDIAGEIRKFPYCFEFSRGDSMLIFPEIRVFVDVDEFSSELYITTSKRLIPEIEGVIVIVEDSDSWFVRKCCKLELYETSNSLTRLQNTIFYFFENNIFSFFYILDLSLFHRRDIESRILSTRLIGEGIISSFFTENVW